MRSRGIRLVSSFRGSTLGRRTILTFLWTESIGQCTSKNSAAFAGSCSAFVGLLLIYALYLSWTTRQYPSEFAESTYIAASVFYLLQLLVLGGPILVIAWENNSTFYIVLALVLFLASFGITGLIFVPKFIANRTRSRATILRGVEDVIRRRSTGQDTQYEDKRASRIVSQHSAAEDELATNAAQRKESGEATVGVVPRNSSVAEIRRRAAASMQRASATAESAVKKQTFNGHDNDPTIEEIRKLLTLKEGEKDDATTLNEIRNLLSNSKLAASRIDTSKECLDDEDEEH